jgi:ferredoxin
VAALKKAFPQRFLLARTTHIPPVRGLVDLMLFEGDRMVYVPKDRVVRVNQALDLPLQTVLPSRVVEHFIEQADLLWLMGQCICRAATPCRDYPIDLGCLFLGEAAAGINPRLGHRVTRDEAMAHARRCREAGLVHLVGRNKVDTVWLGVSPGDRLLTICNCCPCCCLWRMLPQMAPELGDRVARMPGVTVTVTSRCTGCGACAQGVCFVNAIRMEGDRAVIGQACRGCGRCAGMCPQGAIEVDMDSQAVSRSIARLAEKVDVT